MRARFRELWRTPGVQVVLALWPFLLLSPMCGYVLASWEGLFVCLAGLVGLPLGFLMLWGVYAARCAFYRRGRRRLAALCPRCVQLLEGRRICAGCSAELPPVAYLLGAMFARLCPHCNTPTGPHGRPVSCFDPKCGRAAVIGFADVPGQVLLLLVERSVGGPRVGAHVEGTANRSTLAGPRAAFVVVEVNAGEFTPGVLESAVLGRLTHVWVGEGVVERRPDALLVLAESAPAAALSRIMFAGAAPPGFPGAKSNMTQTELVRFVRARCGL